MISSRQFPIYLVIALGTGLCDGADLASAKHAYEEKDYTTALKELTPLAERGDPDAQFLLGKMYWTGQGVLKDNDQALKWLTVSATKGNADAQFFVGSYYLLPHRNTGEGLKWLRLSAEQGNQDAQLILGKTCMEGNRELPRDPIQADMWLRLAAKNNLPFYAAELAAVERNLSPEQIEQGKALAAAWKPKPGLNSSGIAGSGGKPGPQPIPRI
jgi:TPR repeat protein